MIPFLVLILMLKMKHVGILSANTYSSYILLTNNSTRAQCENANSKTKVLGEELLSIDISLHESKRVAYRLLGNFLNYQNQYYYQPLGYHKSLSQNNRVGAINNQIPPN